jgi:hypothetical protein
MRGTSGKCASHYAGNSVIESMEFGLLRPIEIGTFVIFGRNGPECGGCTRHHLGRCPLYRAAYKY